MIEIPKVSNSAEFIQYLWGALATLVASITLPIAIWSKRKIKRLLFAKEAAETQKNDTVKELAKAQKDIPELHVYTVVVDGPKDAGKTCLVQKLVNPCAKNVHTLNRSDRVFSATEAGWDSDAWPVIWKSKSDRKEIFCVKTCDIGGEKMDQIPSKLKTIISERGIVLFVIDAKKLDDPEHMQRFSESYALIGYLNEEVKKKLRGVVYFINKMDLIPDLGQTREELKRKAEKKLASMAEVMKSKGLRCSFVYGSVANEEGLFQLLAEIYRTMEIEKEFPTHSDMIKKTAAEA
mgnify:CR=1 FL=1